MKKYTLLIILVIVSCTGSVFAQMVGTNIYLQGRYLEIGMNNNGSFGTCNSAGAIPGGYHPHQSGTGIPPVGTNLAEVYDYGKDGWAVAAAGAMPYMGDYTYVGSPFEGWELQIGTGRVQAFQNCAGTMMIGGSGMTMIGSNVAYTNAGGSATGRWQGTATVSGGGLLSIRQETIVDTNASWVKIKVRLRNAGATTLSNIYYFRSCDPDIDQTWAGGGFYTNNIITYQVDTANRVLVSAIGTLAGAYMGLGAKDSRARCCIYDSWALSSSVDLATMWNGTASITTPGAASGGDIAIGLTFKLDSLIPGDSIDFSYAYIFSNPSAIDSAFAPCAAIAGAAITSASSACTSTTVNLSSTGTSTSGVAYQWQSSPDSAAWANIPGATSSTYITTGLSATTYYRLVATCITGGSSAVTSGVKVVYVICPIAGPSSICAGATTTLADATPGGTWSSSNPGVATVGTSTGIVNGVSAGTAIITYAVGSMFVTQLVAVLFTPSSILGSDSVCIGASISLIATTPGGSWSSSDVSVASVASATGVVTGASVGIATITYSIGGCFTTKVISVMPCGCGIPTPGIVMPTTTVACSLTTVGLLASGYTLGIVFQWQSSSDSTTWTDIPGASANVYIFTGMTVTTYYRLKVACVVSGFSATTPVVKIIFSPCSSVDVKGIARPGKVSLFPNPVKNELVLNVWHGAYSTYAISNGVWQKVLDGAFNGASTYIDVKMLPAGMYYLTLTGPQGKEVLKFVKE
jgi:hypothetical protein